MKFEDLSRLVKTDGHSPEISADSPPTHEDVEQLFPGYREKFKRKLVNLGIITRRKKIPFLDELKRHGDDSQAWYFCDKWNVGDDVIMGQYMKPLSVSSEHQHGAGIHEFYYPLAEGDFFVRMDRGNRNTFHKVTVGDELEIPINTHHGAFTMQDDTIAVIVMRGAAKVPEEKWHGERRPFSWKSR